MNVYTSQQPVIDGLKLFNFPQSVLDTVYQYPMDELLELRKKFNSNQKGSEDAQKSETSNDSEKSKQEKKKEIETLMIEQFDR